MTFQSCAIIKRPANITAYGVADVIGVADTATPANAGSAILEFKAAGPKGGHVKVEAVNLRIDLAAIPAGMTTFRLYLYDAAPAAILDNAAWDLSTAADRRAFLGYVDIGTVLDLGSTLFVQNLAPALRAKLAAGKTSLYGLLVTAAGYTPASGTIYEVTLVTTAA